MTRQIKFRKWNPEIFCMSFPFELKAGAPNSFHIEACNILMQYTGLHDCEGKEVFEGDILEAEQEYNVTFSCVQEENPEYRTVKYKVIYDDGSFKLDPIAGFYSIYLHESIGYNRDLNIRCVSENNVFEKHPYDTGKTKIITKNFKVIGNIYENPELLGEQEETHSEQEIMQKETFEQGVIEQEAAEQEYLIMNSYEEPAQ